MMEKQLGFQIDLDNSFEDAIEIVTAALKKEGFGVLTRIDVSSTLKEKIGVDFRPYVILGTCNPALAYKALSSDPQVGLLLPCNVTVDQTDEAVRVSIIDPEVMLSIEPLKSNQTVVAVAAEARAGLKRVAEALAA